MLSRLETTDARALSESLRDIVALSTLPAMWLGAEPLRIAESLAASLFTTLNPQFIYVSLAETSGGAALEVAQVDRYEMSPGLARQVGSSIITWARSHDPEDILTFPNPLGAGSVRVTTRPLGAHAELGVVAAAFLDPGLPNFSQHLVLNVAASQAYIAISNTHLMHSLRQSERRANDANSELAERIAELQRLNDELKAARQAALDMIEDALVARRQAEHAAIALRESERRFRRIADEAPMLIWMTDESVNVTFTNKTLLDFIGLDHFSDFTGQAWGRVVHPGDLPQLTDVIENASRTHQPYTLECRIREAASGEYRWFLLKGVPRFLTEGTFVGLIGTAVDIEEQKQAAAALQALNITLEQQVAARTSELEQANLELQRSNRELQDFAYVASHDLQEPLRKISTFADLLRHDHADGVDETGHLYIDRMQQAALRMSTLLQDLLAFSRIASQDMARKEVSLNQIVSEVLTDLEVSISEVGATVDIGELPQLEADPLQMRQLFQNLVGNALKFRRPDHCPSIRIAAQMEYDDLEASRNGVCRIRVTDDGIGFDVRYLDRILAPFQRLHEKTEYPGTGMGLAICRRIVERHQGSITAESTPGQGATFVVTLPVRNPGHEAGIPA